MPVARTTALLTLLCGLAMANPSWAMGDGVPDFDLPPVETWWQFVLLLVNLDEVVETVAFYVGLASILVILFGFTLALRQYLWSGYTGIVAFGLVWIVLNDQNLSGIYWSGVALDPRALVTLGYVMASANFVLAGLSTPPGLWQSRLRWPLFAAALLAWATWPLGRALPEPQAYLLFHATAITAGLTHSIPFSTFTQLDGRPDVLLRRTVPVLGLITVICAGIVSAAVMGADFDIIFINRLIILMMVAFLCAFFALRVKDLRRDREAVIAKSIADAQREAQISRDLLAAQKEHAQTLEVARLQRMRLAEASHDIRQPISSLRTTMAALTAKQPAEVKEQLGNAFDYLDQLAGSYMEEARADAPIAASSDTQDDPPGTETVSTALLAQTLDSMFRDEAEAAQRALHVEATDIAVTVAPLATLRILSNLLSNAIKHSAPGVIALSVRDDGDTAVIEVSNSGVLPDGDVFAPYAKGSGSGGEGLGLAIAYQQARDHGYSLTHDSNSAEGTSFQLRLPRTAAQS